MQLSQRQDVLLCASRMIGRVLQRLRGSPVFADRKQFLTMFRTSILRVGLHRSRIAQAILSAGIAALVVFLYSTTIGIHGRLSQISDSLDQSTDKIVAVRRLAMLLEPVARSSAAKISGDQGSTSKLEIVNQFTSGLEAVSSIPDGFDRQIWRDATPAERQLLTSGVRSTVAAGRVLADAVADKIGADSISLRQSTEQLGVLKLQFIAQSDSVLDLLGTIEGRAFRWLERDVTLASRLAAVMIVLAMIAAAASWIAARSLERAYSRSVRILRTARRIASSERSRASTLSQGVDTLNSELLEKIQRLNEANDEILRRGKLAQLGQLTATVAHEIRNPLGAIRTAAYLIDRKTKDKSLGIESPMKRIATGVARCDKIISELLDFTRSNAPTLKPHRFDAWLKAAIEEDLKELPSVISMTYMLSLGDTVALFDEDRMRRVLINLLSNASEAMVGKSDDIGFISGRQPQITVKTELVNGMVEISVIDNGPGITEENMKRIMEPLFTTKSFGVGLGLPAVQKILQQHRGGLRIESGLGCGATFTAWFPIASPACAAA